MMEQRNSSFNYYRCKQKLINYNTFSFRVPILVQFVEFMETGVDSIFGKFATLSNVIFTTCTTCHQFPLFSITSTTQPSLTSTGTLPG